MSKNLDKLKRLLAELFQLDQADLDFGIYRIMNQKRDDIVRFLDDDLLPQVKQAFSQYEATDRAAIQTELDEAIAQASTLGVDPDTVPKVVELRAKLDESGVDIAALESEVFSHLYSFFRRYYHEGDFLSLRRYKEGVYAIPYEGEEVKLHWANADQYYIKSSEYLRDYAFKLPSGKRVHFKLVEASTEQDNNKAASGKERRFIYAGLATEENQATEITENTEELVIRFAYQPDEQKRKQKQLNDESVDAVLSDLLNPKPSVISVSSVANSLHSALSATAPTDANPDRTVLAKHLTDYTARNTFDYFIHKDLGGFLRRELDFYIKNEVMHLDDIENETVPRVEQYLSKIKALRMIAHKIIAFLEQLENFQKKLWLKKKFVIETNYCVTLDRVPEELYEQIAKSDAQREEWVKLFAIDEVQADQLDKPAYSKPLTVEFLKANPFLVLDTRFFEMAFKDTLLASMEILDEQTDGLLIHGENSQALHLMNGRWREQVKCAYIDPPYNTDRTDFPYKDAFQHSSWLAMIVDRIRSTRHLLASNGVLFVSIDSTEAWRLDHALGSTLGESNRVGTLVWKGATDNNPTRIATEHEYLLCHAKNLSDLEHVWNDPGSESKQLLLREYERLSSQGKSLGEIQTGLRLFISRNTYRLSGVTHYNRVDAHGAYTGSRKVHNPGKEGYRYDVVHPTTGKPCVQPARGYRYHPDRMKELVEGNRILYGEDESQIIQIKVYLEEYAEPLKSVIALDSRTGANALESLFGSRDGTFRNPKPVELMARLFAFAAPDSACILDYFAGSGTTGHAVISLNRRDGAKRRYLLVEMGEHFDTVLKPRIQKVVYSKDWKDGKPVSREGSSHMFKYIRLESYEDALNNLALKRTDGQQALLDDLPEVREEYMLSYMLDVDSRGSASLLDVDAFDDPYAYKMNIARGDETKAVNVDLVETFNYLIGLTVKHIDNIRGVRVINGTTPSGERVLVLWRKVAETDNDALDKWFTKQGYNSKDMEYDLIYVNGDNNLENLRREDHTWKVRLIEEDFHRLMFDVEDV